MNSSLPILNEAPRTVFLDVVPESLRGILTNAFLNAGPRAGVVEAAAIVQAVYVALVDRQEEAYTPEARESAALMLSIVTDYPEAAEGFADYCVRYSALPEASRQAIKEKRQQEHLQRFMETQPATEKQIRYLRSMGYEGEISSKGHACSLIPEWQERSLRGEAA